MCALTDLPFSASGLLPLGGAGKYRPKPTPIVRREVTRSDSKVEAESEGEDSNDDDDEEETDEEQCYVPFCERFVNAERKESICEFICTLYRYELR